jgi:hypothetical protein
MKKAEAIFNLKVDTGNSVEDVEKLDKAIKDTQTTAGTGKGVEDFAKKLDALDKQLAEGNLTIRQRSRLVKEYQQIALQAGETSPVGDRAVRSAAQLTDQIGDMNQRVRLLASDTLKLDTALQGISVGASVFQGVQSAMALTGVENEELIKSMQKLQAVQGVTNAIQQVTNALNKDAILGIQLRIGLEKARNFIMTGTIAGTTALAGAEVNLTRQTTASTMAFKALRIALIGLGIGAILVLLASMLGYWDKIAKAVGLATDEKKKYAKQQEELNKAVKEQAENVSKESASFATLIARLKASNAGSKERKDLIKQINKEYGTTLKNLSDEAEFQNQLNNELKNYLEFQRQKYILQKNEELIVKNLKKQDEIKRKIAEKEKEIKETTKEYYDLIRAGATVERSDTAIPRLLSELDGLKQSLTDAENRFTNYGEQANKANGNIDKLTNGLKKYVDQSDKSNKATKEKTDWFQGVNIEMLKQTDYLDLLLFKWAELTQKIAEPFKDIEFDPITTEDIELENFDGQLSKLEQAWLAFTVKMKAEGKNAGQEAVNYAIQLAESTQQVLSQISELQNVNSDNDLKQLEQRKQRELELAKGNANAEKAINEKFAKESEAIKRRMFDREKKFKMVEVAINTASAIAKSVAASPTTFGLPFSAFATTTGALQLATIAKSTFDGGAQIASASPQQLSTPVQSQQTSTAELPETEQPQQQQTVKVVVLENDITNIQNKVKVAENLSSF